MNRNEIGFRYVAARIVIGGLASALICGGAGTLYVPTPRSVAYRVVPTAAIVESSSTLGFADSELYTLSTTEMDQQLSMMQGIGVENVRISISWQDIESPQGQYDWSAIDNVVNAAEARNMGILGVLSETPDWAGNPVLAGMPDPDVFAQFAQAVATRYKDEIFAYEIWNEPNAKNFLDPVDPAGYTTLLQAAYPLIKQVGIDNGAEITVIGGVVGAGATEGNVTMSPVDFIQGMYDAQAQGFFDALSFHPYEYSFDFSAGATEAGSPFAQLQQILTIMADNGDEDLKVWATEYGQPTTEQLSEQQQYDFIQDFLASWPTIAGTGPMFIYTLLDTDSGNSNKQDNFGVYFSDLTPKQAVQAIEDFLNSIPGPTEPTPPSNPFIETIKAAVQWVGAATRAAIRGGANLVVDVVDVIANVVKGLGRATASVISGGIRLAAAVVTGIVRAAANVVSGAADLVKGGVDEVAGAASNIDVPTAAAKVPATAAPKARRTAALPESSAPSAADEVSAPATVVSSEPEAARADSVPEHSEPSATTTEKAVQEDTESAALSEDSVAEGISSEGDAEADAADADREDGKPAREAESGKSDKHGSATGAGGESGSPGAAAESAA
jgi:polysaccharide biosynthesis protein PslG